MSGDCRLGGDLGSDFGRSSVPVQGADASSPASASDGHAASALVSPAGTAVVLPMHAISPVDARRSVESVSVDTAPPTPASPTAESDDIVWVPAGRQSDRSKSGYCILTNSLAASARFCATALLGTGLLRSFIWHLCLVLIQCGYR